MLIKGITDTSTPDTWLPIDASFKQYEEQEGMNLGEAVHINPEELISAASKGATVNDAEGWVQHLNTAALQSQLDTYQKQLAAHIQQQNGGQSTVGDILGQRTIKPSTLPYLDAALPYTVQTRSRTFAEIPSNLKARFRYTIHTDAALPGAVHVSVALNVELSNSVIPTVPLFLAADALCPPEGVSAG